MHIPITLKREDNGTITAEYYPRRPGMPVVGRGSTALEAIGSLCVNDQIIEIIESDPIDVTEKSWSVKKPKAPSRSD